MFTITTAKAFALKFNLTLEHFVFRVVQSCGKQKLQYLDDLSPADSKPHRTQFILAYF